MSYGIIETAQGHKGSHTAISASPKGVVPTKEEKKWASL